MESGTMEAYLAPRAKKGLKWRGPVAVLCLALACTAVITAFERAGELQAVDALAYALILALLLWPVARIALHAARRRDALIIARALADIAEETVPLESFSALVHVHKPAKRLCTLVARGYLRSVHMDPARGAICLTAPNARVAGGDIVEVECPGCGAKNRVAGGRIGRCEYCGQPLAPHNKRKKENA